MKHKHIEQPYSQLYFAVREMGEQQSCYGNMAAIIGFLCPETVNIIMSEINEFLNTGEIIGHENWRRVFAISRSGMTSIVKQVQGILWPTAGPISYVADSLL